MASGVTEPGGGACPLCGGPGELAFQGSDRFYGVTDYRQTYACCSHCHLVYADPMPSRATIAGFYPSGYWGETTPEKKSLPEQAMQLYVKILLQWDPMGWFRRLNLDQNANVLDVGCSRGDWAALMAAAGFHVEGIEADPRAAHSARTNFGLVVHEQDLDHWQPQPQQWDAITAFHVLEHLRHPAAFLETCYQALRPGGLLLLRVPHYGSWQATLFGKHWKGLELPRHLFHFRLSHLTQLLRKTGFSIQTCSTFSLRDGPPAASSSIFPMGEPTWQSIKGRPSLLRTSFYFALTWFCAPFEALAACFGKGAMITLVAHKPP